MTLRVTLVTAENPVRMRTADQSEKLHLPGTAVRPVNLTGFVRLAREQGGSPGLIGQGGFRSF